MAFSHRPGEAELEKMSEEGSDISAIGGSDSRWKKASNLGRGGGVVVSALDFCSPDPSSILTGRYVFH